ncbi:protein [Bosea sp. BIWAKO-01]|nr:protein [Bosea sp. BIWAKO-01]
MAGTPVSTQLKVLREVAVENRPRGTIALFTLAFPLGGQAAPAAKPVK